MQQKSVQILERVEPDRYAEIKAKFIAPDGTWRVLPAAAYSELAWNEFRFMCHQEALYGVVTAELVEWLRAHVDPRETIEIGSGKTGLGRAVGIRMTDADVQSAPEQKLYYSLMGQPTIKLPPDVERLDAASAIARYKPDTVIGMWVTQLWKPHMGSTGDASVYGIDEKELLKHVRRYIVIGNDNVHGKKEIMKLPHETYRFSWLLSRSDPKLNAIYVWERDP